MNSTARTIVTVVICSLAMIYFAISVGEDLRAACEPGFGLAGTVLVPAAAFWELWRAWSKGPEAADAVARMIGVVALALLFGSAN
jgi:hypothetical protein